jgi:hypothetical protein
MSFTDDTVPTFADWGLLPFVRAFVLETFRWRPGAAAGLQHRAVKDIFWVAQFSLFASIRMMSRFSARLQNTRWCHAYP